MSEPAVSVVIVSDFEAGTEVAWADLQRCLEALARQDFAEPAEILVCEWVGFRDAVPAGLERLLPSLRMVYSDARTSFELKNEGVRQARAPLVAVLDADCTPVPGWLSAAVQTLRTQPETAAVAGRTLCPGRSRLRRVMALSGRTVGDEGTAAETRHVATNNAAYRRDVYLRHPLIPAAGNCGHQLQSAAIRRSEGRLYFQPAMEAEHESVDWARDRDVRRFVGQAVVATRLMDPLQPYAWLVRLRYASIPIFVLGKTLLTAYRCCLRGRHHGVRWYELPVAILAGFVRHTLEVPGMIQAFRGQPLGPSRYR
jgi:hypothetical protein